MDKFERRLDEALDKTLAEWNPFSKRTAGAGIAPAQTRQGSSMLPPGMGHPQFKNAPAAAPVAGDPFAKFRNPPFNLTDDEIRAIQNDPHDTEAFNAIAARRGKPIASMVRQAALQQPESQPTMDDMR